MSFEVETVQQSGNVSANLIELIEQAKGYAENARSKNTNRAYRSDWRHFEAWCSVQSLRPLPAEPTTVAFYITDMSATHKVSSIARRLTAIRQAHVLARLSLDCHHPAVKEVWKGIRNTKGIAQTCKTPILTRDLREMVQRLDVTALAGCRDAALILLGFSGAFRRSELVAIDLEDLAFSKEGLAVTLRRSKTDQEGSGRVVGIPYGSNPVTCPVRSLQEWLARSRINAGPIFRSINRHETIGETRLTCRSVALIVKRAVVACAKDGGMAGDALKAHELSFAGHSLRAGLVTSAAMNGVPEHSIMRQTGHRKSETLRKYIRMGSLFQSNAAAGVGL